MCTLLTASTRLLVIIITGGVFLLGINTLLGRNKKFVLFKIYFFFSINIDMVDFRVLFYLYRNRNINGIIENKKDFYMTVLVEGYNDI